MTPSAHNQPGLRRPRTGGLGSLIRLVGINLLIASVLKELRTPAARRTWHGLLFDRIPYDLRPPTPRRIKSTFWNPRNRHVLVPTAFGVGWSINLAGIRAIFG